MGQGHWRLDSFFLKVTELYGPRQTSKEPKRSLSNFLPFGVKAKSLTQGRPHPSCFLLKGNPPQTTNKPRDAASALALPLFGQVALGPALLAPHSTPLPYVH